MLARVLIKAVYFSYRSIMRFVFSSLVKVRCQSYEGKVVANYYSSVTRNTSLGNNVNFNGLKIKGAGKVSIGDNFHSGMECVIITDTHDYNSGETIPYGRKKISQTVVIDENVWIGDRVIILGGTHIHEGAIIQAGSVIHKNVPPFSIVTSASQLVVGERNKLHYLSKKKQRKFH